MHLHLDESPTQAMPKALSAHTPVTGAIIPRTCGLRFAFRKQRPPCVAPAEDESDEDVDCESDEGSSAVEVRAAFESSSIFLWVGAC